MAETLVLLLTVLYAFSGCIFGIIMIVLQLKELRRSRKLMDNNKEIQRLTNESEKKYEDLKKEMVSNQRNIALYLEQLSK